jgi:hypothetical protein
LRCIETGEAPLDFERLSTSSSLRLVVLRRALPGFGPKKAASISNMRKL